MAPIFLLEPYGRLTEVVDLVAVWSDKIPRFDLLDDDIVRQIVGARAVRACARVSGNLDPLDPNRCENGRCLVEEVHGLRFGVARSQ